MSIDLTGITNQNEYYTNHYFASVFEENASETISAWRTAAKDGELKKTPWALLRDTAKQYYPIRDRYLRAKFDTQTLVNIRTLADAYLQALGYPQAQPEWVGIDDKLKAPIYLELKKANGAPALWVMLAASNDKDAGILENFSFPATNISDESISLVPPTALTSIENEDLVTKILFGSAEPPRFILLFGMNQIALIDRNKWNEKRYLQFELEEIFSRHEETTMQAMSVLLHRDSLCPTDGTALLDELDANSQKHAAGVSQDLKFALRESIELLGNEVLYDMAHRQGRDLDADPVDAGELTLECLRYMYRMLFVFFIESRPELGYAPIKTQSYLSGYSLESLRDIADVIRDDVTEVGNGLYLHETLSKLYELIYNGYPESAEDILKYSAEESLHDMFVITPLKAHIFDPEYTKMITNAKLRNSIMLRIIDLMSLTRETGRRNGRRGRISYANLGINQMGSVYEALLSYRGFVAEDTLFEVKRAGDSFNELDVGYFVSESELDQYAADERVRYENGENKGKLRSYEKGTFIYRLAGREREKSASYYTPEVLTKCLVKYALKELLEGKTADEILNLTICEPAMGSAAFLNEAVNQLAEAYIDRKQKELGEIISYEDRFNELQKIKMYIADRNVYGVDLNPIAVELAEVSLWLNTIFEGGFVPWFGTQLVNGNSLIGARRQCYRVENLTASSKGMRWYENAPDRVPIGIKRMPKKQVYHFLLGDTGMASYSDTVIKSLEPNNMKRIVTWNKKFNIPYEEDDLVTLLRLSASIDELWESQINLRKQVAEKTQDVLSVFGHEDLSTDSHTTIHQKDKILSEFYKTEHMKNAGPYARLKFAMDYWCALWFWPIAKADLLPSRSEFFFDMSLILEGTTNSVLVTDTATSKKVARNQLSFLPTEMQQLEMDILKTYSQESVVDIPTLRRQNPRLNLAFEIAEQNHFMHWELEFADLFSERGGFDLIIGNPPWVKMVWNEQDVLSDNQPLFAVKKFTANETIKVRAAILAHTDVKSLFLSEYESLSGKQTFLNATQNYPDLKGQQTNLYKCFLPQAWMFGAKIGVSAFVHPDGVFNDPNAGLMRERLYPLLRYRFHFANEKKLFADIKDYITFCLNVYCNAETPSFKTISNLYDPITIDQCFDVASGLTKLLGIKDSNGNWCTQGHCDRVIDVGKSELSLFDRLFDDGNEWKRARLPVLHAKQLVSVLECIGAQNIRISDVDDVESAILLDEAQAQKNGIIVRVVHFPQTSIDMIYSGSHFGVANPLFKTSRRICKLNSDFDVLDLSSLPDGYLQRCNYSPACVISKFVERIPKTKWGTQYHSESKLIVRRMLNQSGERTLNAAIAPPETTCINTVTSVAFSRPKDLAIAGALFASIPFDGYIKLLGRGDLYYETISKMPFYHGPLANALSIRSLLLNALTNKYEKLWEGAWDQNYSEESWAKDDHRLRSSRFSSLTCKWTKSVPLISDYERRQALVEIDVLTAIALGMSLSQLKTLYSIQFPVLNQYEEDTWYSANGRIVFTTNRSLVGIGFDRPTWENEIKCASSGKKCYRTITDDTLPGGPIERTIEYIAPFDRCNREQDYATAWEFFEDKYGGLK